MNNERLVEYVVNSREVVISDHIKVIGEGAFAKARQLRSLVIPNSVITIENEAFSQFSKPSLSMSSKGLTIEGNDLISNSSQLESGQTIPFIAV